MDLSKFCASEADRPILAKPFTRGQWSYGTNGRVLVRIPRQDDIPEKPDAPDVEKLFEGKEAASCTEVLKIDLPASDDDDACDRCDGRGVEHDCPGCHCKCDECDGTGATQIWHGTSFGLGDAIFNAQYLWQIRNLPGLRFGKPSATDPIMFVFDGGEGLVMPMRSKLGRHEELKVAMAA